MRRNILVVILCLLITSPLKCQIQEWDYSVRVHGGTDNFYVNLLGELIMAATVSYAANDRCYEWVKYMPTYDWNVCIPSVQGDKLSRRSSYMGLPWKDNSVGDFSVGLDFRASHLLSVWGYYVNLDYKNQGFEHAGNRIIGHFLSPGAGLSVRPIGIRYDVKPLVEIGVAYDIPLEISKNTEFMKDVIRGGFVGVFSAGVAIASWHTSFSIQYSRNFYNLINTKYEHDGELPFADSNWTNQYVSLKITHFWNIKGI